MRLHAFASPTSDRPSLGASVASASDHTSSYSSCRDRLLDSTLTTLLVPRQKRLTALLAPRPQSPRVCSAVNGTARTLFYERRTIHRKRRRRQISQVVAARVLEQWRPSPPDLSCGMSG